jgi:hypothetical protein
LSHLNAVPLRFPVATDTVTTVAAVPLTIAGFGDTEQVAFGIEVTGAQVSATDPESDWGARLNWNVAVWPAETVALVEDPEAGEIEKLSPVPASGMVRGVASFVVTTTEPAMFPSLEGVKLIPIEHELPGLTLAVQLLVIKKSVVLVRTILLKSKFTVPVLEMISDCGWLNVPTA